MENNYYEKFSEFSDNELFEVFEKLKSYVEPAQESIIKELKERKLLSEDMQIDEEQAFVRLQNLEAETFEERKKDYYFRFGIPFKTIVTSYSKKEYGHSSHSSSEGLIDITLPKKCKWCLSSENLQPSYIGNGGTTYFMNTAYTSCRNMGGFYICSKCIDRVRKNRIYFNISVATAIILSVLLVYSFNLILIIPIILSVLVSVVFNVIKNKESEDLNHDSLGLENNPLLFSEIYELNKDRLPYENDSFMLNNAPPFLYERIRNSIK